MEKWAYSAWKMLRELQNVASAIAGITTEDLCVPESRRTTPPTGEVVELASHVRVQKNEESTHCASGLGSVNFPSRKVWIGRYVGTHPPWNPDLQCVIHIYR